MKTILLAGFSIGLTLVGCGNSTAENQMDESDLKSGYSFVEVQCEGEEISFQSVIWEHSAPGGAANAGRSIVIQAEGSSIPALETTIDQTQVYMSLDKFVSTTVLLGGTGFNATGYVQINVDAAKKSAAIDYSLSFPFACPVVGCGDFFLGGIKHFEGLTCKVNNGDTFVSELPGE